MLEVITSHQSQEPTRPFISLREPTVLGVQVGTPESGSAVTEGIALAAALNTVAMTIPTDAWPSSGRTFRHNGVLAIQHRLLETLTQDTNPGMFSVLPPADLAHADLEDAVALANGGNLESIQWIRTRLSKDSLGRSVGAFAVSADMFHINPVPEKTLHSLLEYKPENLQNNEESINSHDINAHLPRTTKHTHY